MNPLEELKMIMINEPDKLIIGANRTLKLLRTGKVRKIFVAKNIPEYIKEDIFYYSKLAGVEVREVQATNEELGAILGKPFNVAVVSLMK